MIPQESDYDRALKRAHDAGLTVCARGWLKVDGTRVIGISSKSDPNLTVHMVTVRDLALTCDCQASQFGRYCMHRALAREFLLSERYAKSDARIAELERQVQSLTLRLIERQPQTGAHGEGAPLVSTSRPVSIFR